MAPPAFPVDNTRPIVNKLLLSSHICAADPGTSKPAQDGERFSMNRLAKVTKRKRAQTPLALIISFTSGGSLCTRGRTRSTRRQHVSVQPHLSPPHPCENRFVAHTLDHITTIEGEVVPTYDSNGAHLTLPSPVGAGLVPALDRAAPPPD